MAVVVETEMSVIVMSEGDAEVEVVEVMRTSDVDTVPWCGLRDSIDPVPWGGVEAGDVARSVVVA